MNPIRDPRRPPPGTRRSLHGVPPTCRRRSSGEGGEPRDSARYAAPKKSNTPLILAAGGGGAVLLVVIIIIATSGGSRGNTHRMSPRRGPSSNGPEHSSGAPQYGGSNPTGRPLTDQERARIAEGERKKNEALSIQDKYIEVRTGTRTVRSEYSSQLDLVLAEIDRAISLYEDFMRAYEEVSTACGQQLLEGNRDAQNLKGMKAIRRELSH